MKKISITSLILGAILVVASIVLIIMGAVSINSPSVYSRTVNGYTYTKMSYSISITGIINGFMLILIGGFTFLGGMLSFILAAVTRAPKFKPCKKAPESNSSSGQIPPQPNACQGPTSEQNSTY